jgi:hypothetical protein
MNNMIFYGPSGIGKYTHMLKTIKRFSPCELKYERRITLVTEKGPFIIRISDIHYEVDVSLLGCNSTSIFHELFQGILDIVSAKSCKIGIIVCLNFEQIHPELLDTFYSYMQSTNRTTIIKFVLVTTCVSFINDNILNCCRVVKVARPAKTARQRQGLHVDQTTNLKLVAMSPLNAPHKIICDKIIDKLVHIDELDYLKFRDTLYDIFIYNLDVDECIYYIMRRLYVGRHLKQEDLSTLLLSIFRFSVYYNNNYRPIYHVEKLMLEIAATVHGLTKVTNNASTEAVQSTKSLAVLGE